MPKASIDYMNARRDLKHATSGGKVYDRSAEYAPDYEPDAYELARSQINSFALWAEASRARYLAANGVTVAELDRVHVDEIPF